MSSEYKGIFNEYYMQGRREQLIIDIGNFKEMLKEVGVDAKTITKYSEDVFNGDIKELGISDDEY